MKRPQDIRVLVACEESQEVTKAFRALGFQAYSCDLQDCSGGRPEWHIKGDALGLIYHTNWDLIIAHPPCTYLAICGNRWFKDNCQRWSDRLDAFAFFMKFTNVPCPHVAIENPVGVCSSLYRKPDQIIEPWQFGQEASKKTCLWLKSLPRLVPTKIVSRGDKIVFASGRAMPKWYADLWALPPAERSKARSKTFPGIALAMAEQWGSYLLEVS